MRCSIFLALYMASSAMAATVYLIRHGEKPDTGGTGLSIQGLKRAQCLKNVFGASSKYDIGYILAQTPGTGGKEARPLETVEPLSHELGIPIDTSCLRDDPACVQKVVASYTGKGNILICWEHAALTNILTELGVDHAPKYPGKRFDLIWATPPPYSNMLAEETEDCPDLTARSIRRRFRS